MIPTVGELGEPPADPESWTDDQWIAWLEATDAVDGDTARPTGTRRWVRSQPGSMLGAAMLGLHELIYGKRDEVAIVADAGGDPPRDDVPDVELDAEHTEVIVRHHPARSQHSDGSPPS